MLVGALKKKFRALSPRTCARPISLYSVAALALWLTLLRRRFSVRGYMHMYLHVVKERLNCWTHLPPKDLHVFVHSGLMGYLKW